MEKITEVPNGMMKFSFLCENLDCINTNPGFFIIMLYGDMTYNEVELAFFSYDFTGADIISKCFTELICDEYQKNIKQNLTFLSIHEYLNLPSRSKVMQAFVEHCAKEKKMISCTLVRDSTSVRPYFCAAYRDDRYVNQLYIVLKNVYDRYLQKDWA